MRHSGIKKILLLGIFISLFFGSHSFAAGTLLLSATGSGNALSIKINNVSEKDISAVVLTIEATPNSAYNSAEHETETIPADPANDILTFTTSQYLNVTPIYVKAEVFYPNSSGVTVSDVSNEVSVTPSAETIVTTPLTSALSGGNITLKGKLDPTLNSWLSGTNFTASLQYSIDSTIDQTTGALKNPVAPGINATIATDGSYAWIVPTSKLTPSTVYYFQETVTTAIKHTVHVDPIVSINSGSGVILGTGNTAVSAALNSQSYTLLAPLPGLTILPDPQVCAQKQAAAAADGSSPPLCSVNDLLNYALKLLIGVSGVVLVLRLMYEGYQYMVTDVPFLKASAKSGFFTALLGLMLALSSYVILNTINPKLVSESVDVSQLSIGVDQTSIDSKTYQSFTGEALLSQSQYSTMVDTISQQQGIDSCIVKATIQVESGWNAAAIGCDENSPYSNVASRMAYLESGVNFDGTTFTPTTNASSSQRNNGCTFDASKTPGYGLDWRFSKGGGLMQVTIFPPDYKTSTWYSSVMINGADYKNRNTPYPKWQAIIKPEANITKGIQTLKQGIATCGNSNVAGIFANYQQGNGCTSNSTLVSATVAKKMSYYNSCKGQ